jgi:hypothetical protein
MKKFSHAGYEIAVSNTGQFIAKTPTGEVKRPTLTSLRKELDKITPFKPFKALVWGWDGASMKSKLLEVEIRGTRRERKHYGPRVLWIDSNYRSHRDVFEDTAANRKLIREWRKVTASGEKIRKACEKRVSVARKAIVTLIP